MKKAVIAAVFAAVTIGAAAGGYATFSASTADSLPTGDIEIEVNETGSSEAACSTRAARQAQA